MFNRPRSYDTYKSNCKNVLMSNLSLNEALKIGVAAHKAGNLQEADRYYTAIIKAVPGHSDANHNLGLLAVDLGKRKEALSFFKIAIENNSSVEQYWISYVDALIKLDRIKEAKDLIKKAKAEGVKDDLIKRLKKLFNINKYSTNTDLPQKTINQLLRLRKQGKPKKVVDQANLLVKKYQGSFLLWNILGASYKDLNQLDEAIKAFKKAIDLNPFDADSFNNIGVAFQEKGKLEKATEAFNKATSLNPTHVEAFYNLGNSFDYQGKRDDAIKAFKKAISINPYHFKAYNNLGNVLKNQNKLDEAIKSYSKALSIKPDFAAARSQKLYQQAVINDWLAIDNERSYLIDLGIIGQHISPLSILSFEDVPERHRLRSENYAKEMFPKAAIPLPARPSTRLQRLRIGYFSSDYKEHPVAYLIAKLLEQHNRTAFEVFGYSLHESSQSELRQRLINAFDLFEDVKGLSDREVALRARQDKIDIAIDLMGYTKHSRTGIFAYRAAPIQINYLGYPGTMGANFMDYIVADKYLIPTVNQKYFTEKQIYLPNSYMPTDNGREFSERHMSRSDMGLPDDAIVFCCFNNNYKITSSEFDIWMRLLNKVEGSVLWLRKSNKWSELNIKKEAHRRKVDPERIVFAGKVPMDEHLARHRLADLFIDTFAFNAHSTATEALWAGLPVITKTGHGFAARVAGSLLNAVGLPELITESEQEYEALALELATHPKYLAQIKAKLDSNLFTQPLFDTEQYTKHLETAYQMAYDRYLYGQEKEHIFVPK